MQHDEVMMSGDVRGRQRQRERDQTNSGQVAQGRPLLVKVMQCSLIENVPRERKEEDLQ